MGGFLSHVGEKMKYFISADQFESKQHLEHFFYTSVYTHCHDGSMMINLFLEPSTRTRVSFETAMCRMQGHTTTIFSMESSSIAKGETIEDTVKTLNKYGDVIVIRHKEADVCRRAVQVSSKPIVNAGNADEEHPTQGMQDVYTLWQHNGYRSIDGMHVAICGDVKHSRTIRSLVKLLNLYEGIHLHLVEHVSEITDPVNFLTRPCQLNGVTRYESMEDLLSAKPPIQALYQTRMQTERRGEYHKKEDLPHYLKPHHASMIPQDCIIMHPLPRGDEIPKSFDDDPRSVYFNQQIDAGIVCRKTILHHLLS
jgi:aspartate carbamoyltransferase catalytic subunit